MLVETITMNNEEVDEHDTSDNDEDPVRRLVGAIVGADGNKEHVVALARRVLSSQIGTNSNDSGTCTNKTDLSSTWRKISRKASHPNTRGQIERVYQRYEKVSSANGNPDLPAKVLVTLTKLMGKRIPMASTSTSETQVSATKIQTYRYPMTNASNSENMGMEEASRMGKRQTISSSQRTWSVAPVPFSSRQSESNAYSDTQKFQNQPKPSNALPKDALQKEEEKLLRECLYSLQGINGERVRYFRREKTDESLPDVTNYEGIRIQSPALSQNILYTGQSSETRLGSGAMDALKMCGEAGWLYTRIQSYIHRVQRDRSMGVVARAFAETLAEQLRDYHSLLTTYESKLPGFTLRQMLVELRGPTFRLKTLGMLVDGTEGLVGGHLLSALYKHSIHGNTVHVEIVKLILHKASRPWFEILYAWTTKGILTDPWKEFFVVENKTVRDRDLWNSKYTINEDQVPVGVLSQEYVKPAFNVGKGINFIRRCLLDGQWTLVLSGSSLHTSCEGSDYMTRLGYSYESNNHARDENHALKETLTEATALVHSHILATLKQDNHLMQHLHALKQFLLLGHGDFFSALMEGLHNEFNHNGGVVSRGIYKHTLLILVDGALRSTNARFLPKHVVERLQVELILGPGEEMHDVLIRSSNMEGEDEIGDHRTIYDIFRFDYCIPDPILSIVHPEALERYKMVFALLFRMRRVEFMLNFTWRQSATLSHALQTSAQYTGIDIASSKGYARATFLLRNISILRQSMMHLIVNLKSYLMFEVIEGGWQRLESAIHTASTLDEAIKAHDDYLTRIIHKAMVRAPRCDRGNELNTLAGQVEIILTIANKFCNFQQNLFDRSLEQAERTAQKRVEAESRLNKGEWGFNTQQDIAEQETFFGLANSYVLEEISIMSDEYNASALNFLKALSDGVYCSSTALEEHSGSDWENEDLYPQQNLMAQLDHNNFYTAQGLG